MYKLKSCFAYKVQHYKHITPAAQCTHSKNIRISPSFLYIIIIPIREPVKTSKISEKQSSKAT